MDLAQQVQQLQGEWPHREPQVDQLLALLHQRLTPDILVHGPPCTGKTSVVRCAAGVSVGYWARVQSGGAEHLYGMHDTAAL